MKNKNLIWILIYTIFSISFKLYVFYSGYQNSTLGFLSHLISIFFILPFIALVIFQKRKLNNGKLSGKDCVKEGMYFTLISIIILGVFNYIFYEIELGKFITSSLTNVDYNTLLVEARKRDKNITLEKVIANQKEYVSSLTAFKDTTLKTFGHLLFGSFSSFICAITLKKA